jgi:hypothetical protein
MCENHKNKQKPEHYRGNHEEIGRDQALQVVLQKRAPILRRRPAVPDQVLGNRGLRQSALKIDFHSHFSCRFMFDFSEALS